MQEKTVNKYRTLKSEISSIKKNLDILEEQKENWFRKKEDLKKEIHENVQKINEIKAERGKKNLQIGELKKLKKSYEESSEVMKIAETAASLDREIRETRRIADDFHRRVGEIMDDTTYDVFIDLSKKINDLKKEQEAAFQKFIDCKNEYSSFSRELRNRMGEMQVLDKVFSKNRVMMELRKEEDTKDIIMEKTRIAEEKIKLKKKLTTEDILALQAGG